LSSSNSAELLAVSIHRDCLGVELGKVLQGLVWIHCKGMKRPYWATSPLLTFNMLWEHAGARGTVVVSRSKVEKLTAKSGRRI
jgi:hypothetical protein